MPQNLPITYGQQYFRFFLSTCIYCFLFQATFVRKHFPDPTEEEIQKWRKQVSVKLLYAVNSLMFARDLFGAKLTTNFRSQR